MVASPGPFALASWANWLFAGVEAVAAPSPEPRNQIPTDDLDFLEDVAPTAPSWPPLQPLPGGHPRQLQAQTWLQPEQQQAIAETAAQWSRDPRLPAIDAAAAQVVLAALRRHPADQVEAHGAISQLIQRVLQSAEPDLARLAAQCAAVLRLSEAQEALAGQLATNGEALGPQGRSELLAALEVLGDGRCVRAMEAFLAQWSSHLQEHEAWRARHIVQVIRRGGRR